jgi:citrate lyase subunit beta/citryl-CoA lyase
MTTASVPPEFRGPGTSALRLRSLLFAPASRPEMLAKLPRSAPDGVVIDLEDAVPPDAKDEARGHAREMGERLAAEHPELGVYVRVNAVRSPWFTDDIGRALAPGLTGVVVPKLDSPNDIDVVTDGLRRSRLSDLALVAGIETAAGVARIDDLLRPPIVAAYFGAEDFITDMGGVRTESGAEVLYARSRVALAARLAGVHAIDQIVPRFDDEERFVADARDGRAIGYGGKLCIHPSQVPLANQVFSPSADEIDHARRLIEAHDAATARGEAAIAFEGQMVDEPMVRRARDTLGAAEGS